MKNVNVETAPASILFKDYLDCVNSGDPRAVAEFFTEDGYIEAPYVASMGMPAKFVGRTAIEATMKGLMQNAPDFQFTSLKIILATPVEVVAEYESKAKLLNGRNYMQLYVGHVTFKNGKIVSHREFLNTIPFAIAFLPNGLSDLVISEPPLSPEKDKKKI